jgi:hypothetical protein
LRGSRNRRREAYRSSPSLPAFRYSTPSPKALFPNRVVSFGCGSFRMDARRGDPRVRLREDERQGRSQPETPRRQVHGREGASERRSSPYR